MNGKRDFTTKLAVLVCISCIALAAGAPTLKSVHRAYSTNVQVFFSLESPKTGTVTCGAFTDGDTSLYKISTCKDSGGSDADCDQGNSGLCFSCVESGKSFTVTYGSSCTATARVKCDKDLAQHNDKNKASNPNANLHSKKSVSVYDSKKSLDYTITLNRLVPGTLYDVYCTMGNDATSKLDVTMIKAELSDVALNAETLTKNVDPDALYFGFITDDALSSGDEIKIGSSSTNAHDVWEQDITACTIYAQSPGGVAKQYEFTTAYSSPTMTITLSADSDLPIVRGSQVNIRCDADADLTDNPANGGTVVPFDLEVSRHTALTNQFGYLTTIDGSAAIGSPTLTVNDAVIGNTPASLTLAFRLDASTALATGDTILLEPGTDIFIQDGATTCTAKSGSSSADSSLTIASLGVTSTEGSGQRLVVVVGASVTAAHYVEVVCTNNLKKNVAGAVTYGLTVSSHIKSTSGIGYTTV